MSKERPILLSAPMVRAILDGRKTQTRRAVKHPIPPNVKSIVPYSNKQGNEVFGLHLGTSERFGDITELANMHCPYGKPRDRLWVRETAIITPRHWNDGFMCEHNDQEGYPRMVQYIATQPNTEGADDYKLQKTPSIFMPRWASRILLEVTNVRVQRLNDISEEDAIAEGWPKSSGDFDAPAPGNGGPFDWHRSLWESINGQGSWDLNPWVWVIDFKRINEEQTGGNNHTEH